MSIKNITKLLLKAKGKENERDAWQLYVSIYPNFNEDTFVTFEEFMKPNKATQEEEKSEEEILKEVKEIINTFNERR